MTEIECQGFSELSACEIDEEYKIAHVLAQSNEQCGNFTYAASTETR